VICRDNSYESFQHGEQVVFSRFFSKEKKKIDRWMMGEIQKEDGTRWGGMFTMARQCSKNTNLRFQEENKEGRFVNEGDFSLKIFIAKEGNS
jgi:hypothetical protein